MSPDEHRQFQDVVAHLTAQSARYDQLLERLEMSAANLARSQALAWIYRPDQVLANTAIPVTRKTSNDILIRTLMAAVPSGAGAITIQIGDHTLALPNPSTGYINLIGLSYISQRSDLLQITCANNATGVYLAFFGIDLGTLGAIGQV